MAMSGEELFVMSEADVRSLVAGLENGRLAEIGAVLRRQPWFENVLAGVRQVRHLKPLDYIKLSARPREMLDCVGGHCCKSTGTTLAV